MTTSGSSGRKGLFVYDREGWRAIAAQFLRHSARGRHPAARAAPALVAMLAAARPPT